MHDSIGWPLARNKIRRGKINHTFGMVRRNRNGTKRPHQGWDFQVEVGYRCYAIADGEIAAIRDIGAYGKQIIHKFRFDLDDDGNEDVLYAVYCHLSRIQVEVGQAVAKGQQIGLSGNTGNARSMKGDDQHLHFEIRERPITGRGLTGRYSPLHVFGECPLHDWVDHPGPMKKIRR